MCVLTMHIHSVPCLYVSSLPPCSYSVISLCTLYKREVHVILLGLLLYGGKVSHCCLTGQVSHTLICFFPFMLYYHKDRILARTLQVLSTRS